MTRKQIAIAIASGLLSASLVIFGSAHAETEKFITDHGDYEAYALDDAQRECRVLVSDQNKPAYDKCIQLTLSDRYGIGTPPQPSAPELAPAGQTPWGVYRDTIDAGIALANGSKQ